MSARSVIFIILLSAGVSSFAKPPDFSFGPRIGIGRCRFTDMPKSGEPGVALQASIEANWQFKKFFAVEFSPGVSLYNAKIKKWVQDGTNNLGGPMLYFYKDIYSIYSVEFPLAVKFSVRYNKFSLHGFFGPGIGLTMGGTHSKIFDDKAYNPGYSGHSMRDLQSSFYLYAAGMGVEFQSKRGIWGIDFQIQHTGPIAKSDGSEFSAQGATIGISWKLTDP